MEYYTQSLVETQDLIPKIHTLFGFAIRSVGNSLCCGLYLIKIFTFINN